MPEKDLQAWLDTGTKNLASLNQGNLFVDVRHYTGDHLMNVMDRINDDYGPDALFIGTQGVAKAWKMRCGSRWPRYTTQWDELLKVS